MNKNLIHFQKTIATALISFALAGCGGGGGGSESTPPNTASAEGFYGGTAAATPSGFQMLVLENSDVWLMYGTQTSTVFAVSGFLQGSGTSSSGTLTSSNLKDFGTTPATAATATATYNATAKTITGTFSAGGTNIAFSGGPISGSLYNYDSAASISNISGLWSTTSLPGATLSFNISTNGSFTGTASGGCNYTGTILPRASGKNVFNIAITFGLAPCEQPNTLFSGIAVAYPLTTGRTQLIIAATNAARTVSMATLGTR